MGTCAHEKREISHDRNRNPTRDRMEENVDFNAFVDLPVNAL